MDYVTAVAEYRAMYQMICNRDGRQGASSLLITTTISNSYIFTLIAGSYMTGFSNGEPRSHENLMFVCHPKGHQTMLIVLVDNVDRNNEHNKAYESFVCRLFGDKQT